MLRNLARGSARQNDVPVLTAILDDRGSYCRCSLYSWSSWYNSSTDRLLTQHKKTRVKLRIELEILLVIFQSKILKFNYVRTYRNDIIGTIQII